MKIHSYELLTIQLALFRTVVPLLIREDHSAGLIKHSSPRFASRPSPHWIPQLSNYITNAAWSSPHANTHLEPQNSHSIISHPRNPPLETLLPPKIMVTLTTANNPLASATVLFSGSQFRRCFWTKQAFTKTSKSYYMNKKLPVLPL